MGSDETLERELSELRQRLAAIELRAGEAERRALAAEQRADEAARREQELRAELAAAKAGRPGPPPVEEPPVEEAGDFPDLAREVEERVKAIEVRVANASRAVQEIAAPGVPAPRVSTDPFAEPAASVPAPAPEPEPEPEEPSLTEKLDINKVSFEQLRELGLSVTQAARLLASRDARGRFRSLDELSELWGFSRDLLDTLMRRLRIG